MATQISNEQLSLMLANEHMTEKKFNIIKAAVELFVEKGYAATSTREIALRAGVAEATIFKHYTTKKELLLYIAEHVFMDVVRFGIIEVLEGSYNSLRDFLTALFKNRLTVIHDNVSLFRLLLQEAPFQIEFRELINKNFPFRQFERLIDQLKTKKLIVNKPNEEIASFLFSAMIGYFVVRHVLFEGLLSSSREEDINFFINYMERALTF